MNPLQENNIISNQPQQLDPPKSITTSTQTDNQCNLGKGLTPLDPSRVKNPFENTHSENNIPLSNLHKVMNENFISEAIKLDNQSNRIRKMIQNQDWLALKHYSRYWHTLKKDLSVNDNGCILYDGKLYIPPNLRDIALHSIHKTHTGLHPYGTSWNDVHGATHLVPPHTPGDCPNGTKVQTMHSHR